MTARHSAPPGQEATGQASQRESAAAPAPLTERSWQIMLAAAVAVFAVGMVLLIWPQATLLVVDILIGISLLVTGLLRLFEGFTARQEGGGRRTADVLIGLLAVVVGLYCLKHQSLTVVLLAFVVGVFWVVHGIAEISVAASAGPAPGRWLIVISGALSLVAGLLVLFWPAITIVLLVMIIGAWLIFYAVVLAVMAFRLRPGGRGAARTLTA